MYVRMYVCMNGVCGLQKDVCLSISKFMAFVHTSVNEMSKKYLTSERRYNYTTPKSFLELVSERHFVLSLC